MTLSDGIVALLVNSEAASSSPKQQRSTNSNNTSISSSRTTTTIGHTVRYRTGKHPQPCTTPDPKPHPNTTQTQPKPRVRHDRVNNGRVTLRYKGQLRRIALGRTLDRTPIVLLIQGTNLKVIHATTGEKLRDITLNDNQLYYCTGKPPGGPPGPRRRHLRHWRQPGRAW